MRKSNVFKRAAALLLCVGMLLSCAACGGEKLPTEVVNGSFEENVDGKWTGWTRQDAAFNVRGVVSDEKVNGAPMEKDGANYFCGIKGANQPMRGTLTSDPFVLSGTGVMAFSMGAGKNTEKVYVEFIDQKSGEVLAKVANEDCDGLFITDHLITKVVDLSAHVGKTIIIRVTDNDDGNDLSYVNLDNFRTLADQAAIDAANAAHAAQIEAYGEKPFEEDETATTLVNGGFETGDLTGWKTLEGNALSINGITPTSELYWGDRSVYGEGEYYLTSVLVESNVGAIRSAKFTLGGDGFITFMIGAAPKDCYVALCDGNTDEELITVGNPYFSDPALALTLLRVYMDASEHLGKVVYLKVVDAADGSNGGFAFMNVDDFRVSLTRDEVAALEVEQMEKAQNETYNSASYDDLTSLRNYYSNYPYPVPLNSLNITSYVPHQVVSCGTVDVTAYLASAKATFGSNDVTDFAITGVTLNGAAAADDFTAVDMTTPGYYQVSYAATYEGKTAESSFTVVAMADNTTIANGDFEAGNLAGWTVLSDAWSIVEGQPAGVISATNYWGEELPYNQEGNYHLDGWNTGIGEPESWAVRSTNFVLSGSGFISARMGGAAAAVKVYTADGTLVGYYKQTRFSDANFPHVGQGGSWADMGTYVMDLSAYVGQELYIELWDETIDGGWAHGFFDAVVTYYETAPDVAALADTVLDGHTGEETAAEITIPWQLAENLA